MTLLREYEDDAYWPEYSTLVIRDHWDDDLESDGEERPEAEQIAEDADDAAPCGTVARAGDGWLRGAARDTDHVVRLEVHDAPPPDDLAQWDDVVETPYHCGTGVVALDMLISGDGSEHVPVKLGPSGQYRARVSVRYAPPETPGWQATEGDVWRVQFWPSPGPPEPPRWHARHETSAYEGSDGWDDILRCVGGDVLWAARSVAADRPEGATADDIDAFLGVGRLDEPLWTRPPEPLPTGHADLDEQEADNHRSLLAEAAAERAELTGLAAQLGVPAPTTRRDLLPFLVAAGVLTSAGSGEATRYGVVADPPLAETVLRLPDDRVAWLRRQRSVDAYGELAADIVSVAQWSPGQAVPADVHALAERLLVSPERVRAAVQHAEREGLLTSDGAHLTALPRAEQDHQLPAPLAMPMAAPMEAPWPEEPWSHLPADLPDGSLAIVVEAVGDSPDRLPRGAPPRAGFVNGAGDLVLWRDGRLVTVPTGLTSPPDSALETAHGVVLQQSGYETVLVRPDGRVQRLCDDDSGSVAVSEDGRHLAFTECRLSRRAATYRLWLVDLADGTTDRLPWPEDRPIYLTALYGGAVYLGDDDTSLRLPFGGQPEPLPFTPHHIDPLSGTVLTYDDQPGVPVILPDGTRHRVQISSAEGLVPGGTALYDFRYEPPAVTLFDLQTGAADARVLWLPHGTDTSTTIPGRPVWEDPHHLLFTVPYSDIDAVRLDIHTGQAQEVPLGNAPDEGLTFVKPLLTS